MYPQSTIDEQDKVLDQMNIHMDTLKGIAAQMGTELTNQDGLLTDTQDGVDEARENLGVVNRKIPIIMRNSDRCRLSIICVLFIAVLILVIVLFH